MSKWNYGCGCKTSIYVQHRYSYREVTVECGSTAPDGGVNQCEACASNPALTPPPAWQAEDYGYDD